MWAEKVPSESDASAPPAPLEVTKVVTLCVDKVNAPAVQFACMDQPELVMGAANIGDGKILE